MRNLHPVLAEKIRPLIKDVKDRRLWEKLNEIADILGEKEPAGGGDFEHDSYRLEIKLDGQKLGISKSTYAMGGDYIDVDYDGARVFVADKVQTPQTAEEFAERIYSIIDLTANEDDRSRDAQIRVKAYLPGAWTELIDFEKIRIHLEEEKRKNTLAAQSEREKQERARPLTEAEENLAKAFGVSLTTTGTK